MISSAVFSLLTIVCGMSTMNLYESAAHVRGPGAGGPCFNEIGQCVGIAFQSLGHGEADGIGYVIPTPVINHFLTDYK